ncbi:RidA family protein [Marinimicrobium sp. ABcell2]|uniref:RidA family protein n=1 Tax=Marinimicrobium sp. ABcell2 TaxID=3069751 RepID=UPI0027B31623|nr:RidA family protein [Marinimicrobium sp. ABcell2]MDQ2075908.1 RidA family protein [Marinimicrobium sp. ABcell2]
MVFKPTTTTLLVVTLFTFGCAVHGGKTPEIERTHYGDHEPEIGYTQVVRVGNRLYLAGLTYQADTVAEQLVGIYDNIEQILSDFDATTAHILREVVYTTDIEALIETIPVRKSYFPSGAYPAATWVQVERLFLPDLKVEVEVTVLLPN